ncbi:uncharacterized protein LOC109795380 [Cajanus cajan]|uniref:Uncharacterized protein n=1 Tax=Cajanus cajan TaxID=3821 RepID=A0A151U2D8_CAJCA|nr:uncharacterized protein LOC109795380 [Cajanus cajan]KYP73424.1 hypothetical protein KK1_006049 [Cajanus cajan]
MRCLQLQSSLLPFPAKLKLRHTTKLFQISTHKPQRAQHFPSVSPLSTKALPHLMVVAPAKSGDLSTLLPISAVLVSAYLIANFVVPGFLTNSFGYDKSNEEQKDDDVNAMEDS